MTDQPSSTRSGVRVSAHLAGLDAGTARHAAVAAERHGFGCVWLDCGEDVYTMTTLAAVAADTTDIRLGAMLDLRGSADLIRVAEMIGLVDQLSGGRLELALSPADDDDWTRDALRLLTARNGWHVPDGRCIPVTPLPAQPAVPVLLGPVADRPPAELLRKLGAGLLIDDPAATCADGGRVALLARSTDAGGGHDDLAVVTALRQSLAAAQASELLLTLTPDQIPHSGVVLATGIRAGEHEVGFLTTSAAAWFQAEHGADQAPAS